MKLIDLSQPVENGSPNCPAHPPVRSERLADHPRDGWRLELLTLASHTGSHVDAPLHKIEGAASLDEISIDSFAGSAVIADLRGISADMCITTAELAPKLPPAIDDLIVLIATGWGDRRANTAVWRLHSPFLGPEAAQWLVNQRIRAVGIDHYSIGGSRDPDNTRTHEILLRAGKWIVEELRFPAEVFDLRQPFTFWSLPVNLKGHSGAFCRPVAVAST